MPPAAKSGGRRRICVGYYPDSLVVANLLDACSYLLHARNVVVVVVLKTSFIANFSRYLLAGLSVQYFSIFRRT